MKLLIDTNVILDMIFKKQSCNVDMELFRKIKESGMDACITASSVTEKDIHDTFRKKWKDYEEDLLSVLTLEECIKMIDNIQK